MTSNIRCLKTALALTLLVTFAPSKGGGEEMTFQPRSLKEYLESNHWVPLPIPDSKMRPGAVIQLILNGGRVESVNWLGDFRSCGPTDQDLGFVPGHFPQLEKGEQFSATAQFGASIIAWLGINANVSNTNRTIMKIEDGGGDAISLLALSIWLSKPGNAKRMPSVCKTYLETENTYIIGEAFRVSKAGFEYINENGLKINISGKVPDANLKGKGGAYSVEGSTVNAAQDFYIGIRHAREASPSTFSTLGDQIKSLEADRLLQDYFNSGYVVH